MAHFQPEPHSSCPDCSNHSRRFLTRGSNATNQIDSDYTTDLIFPATDFSPTDRGIRTPSLRGSRRTRGFWGADRTHTARSSVQLPIIPSSPQSLILAPEQCKSGGVSRLLLPTPLILPFLLPSREFTQWIPPNPQCHPPWGKPSTSSSPACQRVRSMKMVPRC